jgi:hypothetical protein
LAALKPLNSRWDKRCILTASVAFVLGSSCSKNLQLAIYAAPNQWLFKGGVCEQGYVLILCQFVGVNMYGTAILPYTKELKRDLFMLWLCFFSILFLYLQL